MGQVMTAEHTGPEPARAVEIRFSHTTIRACRLNAAEIREIFGLGGTPADDLIDRLVALLASRPSLLASTGVEDVATWEADCGHVLVTIDGMAPGDAAEVLTIAETGQITPLPWQAEADGREHPRCAEDCSANGTWPGSGVMPSGHYWQWDDPAHTSGYLAHRTAS